jgi:pantothenate kinase
MQLPSILNVTEQPIDISGLTAKQTNYYQNLAKKLSEQYKEAGQGRQIFTLSGPAGSGKSVVSAILEHVFREKDSVFQFINVGLDAFHLSNAELFEMGLLDVKGRYDTYDTSLLYEKLSEFKKGESVLFPIYSRLDHHPIPDRLPTSNENILLLLEGQWLLSNRPEWAKIRALSTYNYKISGSNEDMRENVIHRHINGGRTTADAINFYTTSDLPNTTDINKNSVEPDEEILFYKDIL